MCIERAPDDPHSVPGLLHPCIDPDSSVVCCRYMGVDHVLLYDNSMNGGAQAQELRDFIRDGFVTFTLLPGQGRQIPLYDHCAKISARKWAWMVAIDLDEFLDLPEANTTSVEKGSPLKVLLAEFRFRPGAPPVG